MALSRELTRHLHDEDNQPLPKRLKLAENAFTSLDLLLPRKEDVILNWLCGVSKQTSDIVTWQTLKRCLEFQYTHSHASTIKAKVKAALIEALINGLKTDGELELLRAIISCCQSILFNREMQRYFVYRPILIVDLLEQLLSYTSTQMFINCGDSIEKLPELRDCIIDSLDLLIECHRRLTNKLELNNNVITRLIYKLSVFSKKITNEKVTSTVTRCMQRFIFDKSIEIKSFGSEDWAKELFAGLLSKHIKNIMSDDNTTLVISHIFHAATLSFKSSTSTIDMIYRNILNCAPSSTLKIQICGNLFQNLNDITLDIQNEIGEKTLIAYYHEMIDEILALDNFDDKIYNCLDGMAKYNPLIIESKLPEIFKKILLAKKPNDKIKCSYVSLMSDILNACVRLRRDNKLVPWILIALDESLRKKQNHGIEGDDILPQDFTNKFTASTSNMTNALVTEVLMSFIYHFDASSSQSAESETLPTMMEISSRLIVAFFNGIHMFDYSTPPATQQKFVDDLVKFGKILQKLAKLVAPINKYELISAPVLSVIHCWQRVIAFMKNYAPESITEENKLSISQILTSIHRRINKIESNLTVNDNINHLINCCRLEKNRIDENKELKHSEVLDDIENNWTVIIDNYSYIIANFDDSQLTCLARAILSDAYNTAEITQTLRIQSRIVQQHKKLITALIFEIFLGISSKIKNPSSTTNNLLIGIAAKNSSKEQRTGKILKTCKKILLNPQWTQNKSSKSIARYLRVLLMLPLFHLSIEFKKIILLVIFSMTKEWENSRDIIDLCYQILTDILENSNIDILQYIDFQSFIGELSKHSIMNKLLECTLRNVANHDSIAAFIKSNKNIQDDVASTLIECIEKIKSKLKSDEKIAFNKIEKKLRRRISPPVESDTKKNIYQIRMLRISLKDAVVSKKVDEAMLEEVHSTLHDIFEMNDKDDEHPKLGHNFSHDDAILNEGLQIMKIMLQHREDKPRFKNIVKRTWSLILMKPSCEIIPDLFSVTSPKVLKKVLNLLQMHTVDAHKQQNNTVFENCMQMWSCISRVASSSNNIRQLYLQELMQYFGIATLSDDDRFSILKLCTIIVNTKHVHVNEKIVDLIFLVAENCLTNSKSISTLVCDQVLALCLGFTTYRVNMITDRLPIVLHLYRKVIHFIIDESKCKDSLCTEHQLQCLALNAHKVAIAFVKLKKDMSRVSPYLIADLVEMYSEGVIPSHVKGPMDDCIGIFLSNCDHHAIPLLFRALPPATQEIFKTLYDTYNKFYKFTGKI